MPDEDQGRETGKGFKGLLYSQLSGSNVQPLRAALWSVIEQREWDCGMHLSSGLHRKEGVRTGSLHLKVALLHTMSERAYCLVLTKASSILFWSETGFTWKQLEAI